MFEALTEYRTVIVTGPHRSGTTIASEMIASDTRKRVIREELFDFRNIRKAEKLIREGGVIQGPYLLPWTPILGLADVMVVYMHRDAREVQESNKRLRQRNISAPHFDHGQALRLWAKVKSLLPHSLDVDYESLREHPLFVESRGAWGHRQTREGRRLGR